MAYTHTFVPPFLHLATNLFEISLVTQRDSAAQGAQSAYAYHGDGSASGVRAGSLVYNLRMSNWVERK